jgi:hypothetical protein
MAKKKTAETANIKAGPVLRAGDGGGQDPSKTKSYCIRDDWKDINKVNYVAFKSVDGEVQDLTVNGEPAGGGGGGTATVQIINNSSPRGVDVRGPIVVNNMIMADMFENHLWSINMGSSNTYTVPLASSGMQLYVGGIPDEYEPVITGDCTWDADNWCFIITGNCTITV